jgi:hypothetical protein
MISKLGVRRRAAAWRCGRCGYKQLSANVACLLVVYAGGVRTRYIDTGVGVLVACHSRVFEKLMSLDWLTNFYSVYTWILVQLLSY